MSGRADSGSTVLEILVALAILAGATTMIVAGMAPARTPVSDPIGAVSSLLTAARSEAILSGTPILVRLRESAIHFSGEQHDFRAPIGIVLAKEAGTADEVTFLVLPDGTLTGGDISLTTGQSRSTLPLVSRGAGT